VEGVGGDDEDPSLSGVQCQVTGMDGGLMAPRKTGIILVLIGHEVDGGVVMVAVGAETERKVLRNGSLFADVFEIQIAFVDGV